MIVDSAVNTSKAPPRTAPHRSLTPPQPRGSFQSPRPSRALRARLKASTQRRATDSLFINSRRRHIRPFKYHVVDGGLRSSLPQSLTGDSTCYDRCAAMSASVMIPTVSPPSVTITAL
ncbi:hypothetical protein JCM31271_04510 [Halorubrum trueperi]